MIFDFRFSNLDLAGALHRGLARSYEHRRNFVSFLKKSRDAVRGEEPCIGNELKPEASLIRLFFHQAGLINEIGSRFRTAKCTIVGSDRRTAANELIGNCIRASGLWQGVSQLENAEREVFRPNNHFALIHASS